MKTILFLHREELTYLYAAVSKHLSDMANVLHVAYSDKEESILKKMGINVDYNYRQMCLNTLHRSDTLDLSVLEKIDHLFIDNTNNRFNLNASIQSDRGYSILSYKESLLMAQINYMVWKEIFAKGKVDYIFHEPCSLFFNHLAAVMCRAQGGKFMWEIMVAGEENKMSYLNIVHDDFTCIDIEKKYKYYKENPNEIDIERCRMFVANFRKDYNIFMDHIALKYSKISLLVRGLKKCFIDLKNKRKYDRLIDNIDYWLGSQNFAWNKLKNLKDYKKYKVKFEDPIPGELYYYYSFHLEPEAVVLYLGDGLYTNQTKLIENIAAALPVGYYLYVKDHPHDFAYRSVNDYLRLNKIPNIRLICSTISGKKLIKDSVGVFTINGTAGFEGIVLQKQVYCFGKSYYSSYDKINYIHNIRDLKNIIYLNKNVRLKDDNHFFAFINAYLDSLHIGMVDFFMGRSSKYNIDSNKNAELIASDIMKLL